MQNTLLLFSLLAAYAAAIVLAGWFVLNGSQRQHWRQLLRVWKLRALSIISVAANRTYRSSSMIRLGILHAIGEFFSLLARHRLHLFLAAGILIVPMTGILLFKPEQTIYGYLDMQQTSEPVIIALLQGEQLLPPPSLPPEIFISGEVQTFRPHLAGASREWMKLDADFRQRLLTTFQLMEQKGYPMALIEGYRSPERQAYLAGLGSHVTSAGANQSFHQFGLAADCAFLRHGRLVISEKDAWAMDGYRLFGDVAESVGLVWGGRWKMLDFGHVELNRSHVINQHKMK